MRFKFYTLNYDFNAKKVILYNIFNNSHLQRMVEKHVTAYVKAPDNYQYTTGYPTTETFTGFSAFCKALEDAIRHNEASRREYEISVGDAFEQDCRKLEKWDCAKQVIPNIEAVAREVLYQHIHHTGIED